MAAMSAGAIGGRLSGGSIGSQRQSSCQSSAMDSASSRSTRTTASGSGAPELIPIRTLQAGPRPDAGKQAQPVAS